MHDYWKNHSFNSVAHHREPRNLEKLLVLTPVKHSSGWDFALQCRGVWVQSLVKRLGSHMPCDQKKTKHKIEVILWQIQ